MAVEMEGKKRGDIYLNRGHVPLSLSTSLSDTCAQLCYCYCFNHCDIYTRYVGGSANFCAPAPGNL